MLLDAASRIRCIQKVAHFSFHTCFAKREKYEIRAVDKKYKRKEQSKDSTGKIFLQKKITFHHKSLPLSNCLLWSVDHAAILCCWPKSSPADSSRVAACVCVVAVVHPDFWLNLQQNIILLQACAF